MALQTAVILGSPLLCGFCSHLHVVHPRAADRKINSGVTIFDISSGVSTLESMPISVFKFSIKDYFIMNDYPHIDLAWL